MAHTDIQTAVSSAGMIYHTHTLYTTIRYGVVWIFAGCVWQVLAGLCKKTDIKRILAAHTSSSLSRIVAHVLGLSGSYTVLVGETIRSNPHISWPRPTSPPHDGVLPNIAPYGEMPHVFGYHDNTRYTWPHISAACHYFDSADDTAKKFYATIMATGVYSGKTHLTPNIRQSAALIVFVQIPSLCSWSSTVRTRGYG